MIGLLTRLRGVGTRSERSTFPSRINVGCGYDKREGYLNIDVDPACAPDLLVRDNDYSVVPLNYFEEVWAKDVLEHIPRSESLSALLDWASWLRVGGTLSVQTSSILGVADQLKATTKYEDHYGWTICLFGNQVHHGDFHHTGFTEITLKVHILAAGMEVQKFETVDKWLFRVVATKQRGWDDFLPALERASDATFIEALYMNAFARAVDDQGNAYLSTELAKGMSRRQAAKHVFQSPERLFYVARRDGL